MTPRERDAWLAALQDVMGAGSKELTCTRCGALIGRWAGPWDFLEGADHPNIGHAVASHKCQA